MRHKSDRQRALLGIVGSRLVSNQAEMVRLLRTSGIDATQASVSRDIRELGLVKIDGSYGRPEAMAGDDADDLGSGRNGLVTSMEPAGANLIVVRTAVGAANAVAVELDKLKLQGIVGTVAGDDTFFVAVKSRSGQGRVLARLREMMRHG